MLKRFMRRTGQMAVLTLLTVAFAGAAVAQSTDPVEGRDYTRIDPPTKTSGDGIEVVEVFGYSCSHCAHFQPLVSEWKKKLPADVKFEYLPAAFGGVWEVYARVFYTAQTMGVLDKTHDALFEALHTEHRPISKIEDLADFYAEHGVDKAQFLSTLDSFPVNAKVAEARDRAAAWNIEGTPTMVVAGKYRVMAPPQERGGFKGMLEIVDRLIARERAAKSKPAVE